MFSKIYERDWGYLVDKKKKIKLKIIRVIHQTYFSTPSVYCLLTIFQHRQQETIIPCVLFYFPKTNLGMKFNIIIISRSFSHLIPHGETIEMFTRRILLK